MMSVYLMTVEELGSAWMFMNVDIKVKDIYFNQHFFNLFMDKRDDFSFQAELHAVIVL
jgi:hypothetical protein